MATTHLFSTGYHATYRSGCSDIVLGTCGISVTVEMLCTNRMELFSGQIRKRMGERKEVEEREGGGG